MLVAGMAKQVPSFADYDYVGIDHGALSALQSNIALRCAIGDFDSVTPQEKAYIEAHTSIAQLPAHKDETDTEIAIFYALEHGYDEIILYGGLGGRMDHTMANMYLLLHRDLPLILMDEHHYIQVLKPGTYQIPKRFQYLSFLALENTCISEEQVAYPLHKRWLRTSDIYPISNEIIGDYATITIHEGRVLMIQCEDAKES